MKRVFLVCSLLVLGAQYSLWAAVDPADRFLQAYFLIQEADQAEQRDEWAKAHAKFSAALDILREIKTQAPNWNPHIIEFRLKYCGDHVAALNPKVPATPAPAPTPTVEAVAPAPTAPPPAAPSSTPTVAVPVPPAAPAPAPAPAPADTGRLDKMRAELQQAQDRIRQLESTRDDLNAKLTKALGEVRPTETNLRIEQLLEKNKEMAAQFAAAQQQIADLTTRTAELQQARTQIRELESTRDDLSTKLKEALAKAEGNQPNPRLDELLRKNQELTAQLATAQAQLAKASEGATAKVASPELAELRSQLAATRTELEQTRQELTQTRQELGHATKELETARSENRSLRETYSQMAAKLDDAARNLQAAQVAGQKDNEIIRFLRKENELLRGIVDKKAVAASEPAPAREPAPESRAQIPELKGWQPRRRTARVVEPAPVPAKSTAAMASPAALMMKESGRGKLVAELTAPPPPAAPAHEATPAAPRPAAPPTPLSSPLAGAGAKASAVARPEAPASLGPATDKTRGLIDEARQAVALKDYDTAAAKYDAVIAAEPNNLLALSNLAVVRYQQGKLDDAEQSLRRAVTLAPNDSESRSLLGIVYFRKGKLEEAFGELTRAVALNPRNAEAHNYLGITLSEKGWGAAAEQEIRKAIELNPQYADAHFNLAVLYANQRTPRYEMARVHYQKAIELGAQPDPALETSLKAAGAAPSPTASVPAKP